MSTERSLSTEYEATEDVYNAVIGQIYTERRKHEQGSDTFNQLDEKLDALISNRNNLNSFSLAELAEQRRTLKKDINNFINDLELDK